jgi:hypothetical protein
MGGGAERKHSGGDQRPSETPCRRPCCRPLDQPEGERADQDAAARRHHEPEHSLLDVPVERDRPAEDQRRGREERLAERGAHLR